MKKRLEGEAAELKCFKEQWSQEKARLTGLAVARCGGVLLAWRREEVARAVTQWASWLRERHSGPRDEDAGSDSLGGPTRLQALTIPLLPDPNSNSYPDPN